jgi:hypothetical protein
MRGWTVTKASPWPKVPQKVDVPVGDLDASAQHPMHPARADNDNRSSKTLGDLVWPPAAGGRPVFMCRISAGAEAEVGQIEAQWLPAKGRPVQCNDSGTLTDEVAEAVVTMGAHCWQVLQGLVPLGPALPEPNGPRIGIDQSPVQAGDLEAATELVLSHPGPVRALL